MLEETLKIKNMRSLDWIRTPRGTSGLYKFENLEGQKVLAVISNSQFYKKRKEEVKLFKKILKYNPEGPNVLGFEKKKKQTVILLEWKENLFMDKIVYYYSHNE